MIKAAFFDVDGTLYSHKSHQVPPSTREAIAKLRAKGIPCIIATGRHPIELAALPIEEIGFDAYLMLNGQMMLDQQKNVLFSVPITGKAKDLLVEQFQNNAFPLLITELDDMYINMYNRPLYIFVESMHYHRKPWSFAQDFRPSSTLEKVTPQRRAFSQFVHRLCLGGAS